MELVDNVEVKLPDGNTVSFGELRDGYLRYQAAAAMGNGLEALGERYQRDVLLLAALQKGFTKLLREVIPPEPDPTLIQSDPQQYQYLQAMHQKMTNGLNGVIKQTRELAKQYAQSSQEEQEQFEVRRQVYELVSAMPELRDPQKRTEFLEIVRNTARHFGFSDEDIKTTVDNRILRMAYWAGLGLRAEHN